MAGLAPAIRQGKSEMVSSFCLPAMLIHLLVLVSEVFGSKPITIASSNNRLKAPDFKERPRSLPSLHDEGFQFERSSSSPCDEYHHPSYKDLPKVKIYIAERMKTLYIVNLESYVGCDVYYDPTTSTHYEILPLAIADVPKHGAAPLEYHEEAAKVMKILSELPGNSFFPAPIDTFSSHQGKLYSVTKFRFGISFENIFHTGKKHSLHYQMHFLREQIMTDFAFYLAQLITIFETLSENGVFYGKVECRMISLLSNGYLELVDLRTAFRPYKQRRKYVSATVPWAPPEIRSGKLVGPYSHFYSLGGLVYELVTMRPFSVIKADNKTLGFPLHFNSDLKDVIQDLLTVDYEQRIAALSRIKVSPFFAEINWKAIRQGTEPSPITLDFGLIPNVM